MALPAPTSVDGAYWYLISLIVVVALACGLYVAAAILGLVPDPGSLV